MRRWCLGAILVATAIAAVEAAFLRRGTFVPVLHYIQPDSARRILIGLQGEHSAISLSLRHAEAVPALEAMLAARKELGGSKPPLIGASSVCGVAQLQRLATLGVDFFSTQHTCPLLISESRKYNIPMLCGARSIEEVRLATSLGVDMVKIYPVRAIGWQTVRDIVSRTAADFHGVEMFAAGVDPDPQSYAQAARLGIGVTAGLDAAKESVVDLCSRARQQKEMFQACRSSRRALERE